MITAKRLKKTIFVILSVIIGILAVLSGQGNLSAFADSAESVQSLYERTNVLDNLQGSTIGGEPFDIANYPHNDNGEPQIIHFVEFCYSSFADKQSDYGLYVYIYNPQDIAIDVQTARNKIELGFGKAESYLKYPLQFLNYSTRTGYEGRFYKFRVGISNEEKSNILRNLNADSRIYEVIGVELSLKTVVTDYKCAQKYTYSGYAKGYGSELATGDTLTCSIDGLERYLELEVNQTVYRAQGDYYNGEQSQLNSCYFRVPDKYFTELGELTEIACEWYEYFTKPILVAEDSYTYNKINALHGNNTNTLPDNIYFLFMVFWENIQESWFKKSGTFTWTSNYDYSVGDKYNFGFLWGHSVEFDEEDFGNFAAAFSTGGAACEDYTVDGEDLRNALLENSSSLGAPYIHGEYSSALFEDYVQPGGELGYNYKNIKSTDTADIFWNYQTRDLWQKMFTGGYDIDTVYESLDAIVKVTESDLSGTNAEIAERLKISETDVDDLKFEYRKAQAREETVVILRYSSTKYFAAPCAASYCSKSAIDGGEKLAADNFDIWNDKNFNAYVCQETVYLDFDIISLTFTLNDVDTVVPVISSPVDVISDLNSPLDPAIDNDPVIDLILKIIGFILFLVILILLYPLISPLLTAVLRFLVWLVCLPFKAIGSLFKRRE